MKIYYKLFLLKKVKYRLDKWKLKAITLCTVIIFYYFNYNLFAHLLSVNGFSSDNDLQSYINYYSTFETLDSKISLLSKYKKSIRKLLLKKNVNKNVKNINSIYIDVNFRFGNLVAFLNKLLYYCEVVECKFIINFHLSCYSKKNFHFQHIKLLFKRYLFYYLIQILKYFKL